MSLFNLYIYIYIYLFTDFKDSFFWFDRFSPFDLHSATLLRMLLHEVGDGHFLTDSSSKPSAQLPCQFTPRSLQTAMATAYLPWRSGTRNFHCGLAQCNAIICSINVYKLKAIVDWSSRSWAKKNVQWMAINRIKKMEHSFLRKEMQRALILCPHLPFPNWFKGSCPRSSCSKLSFWSDNSFWSFWDSWGEAQLEEMAA